jgi:hypothetical protein
VIVSTPFPPASNVAFGVVFGVFIAASVVLVVVVITWAVRRDRAGREAWHRRRTAATGMPDVAGPPPNGALLRNGVPPNGGPPGDGAPPRKGAAPRRPAPEADGPGTRSRPDGPGGR